MLVHKLCKEFFPDKIPVSIGTKVADGADGELFLFEEDSNKIIKLSILQSCVETDSVESKYLNIKKILNYLIENPADAYVRVYEHKLIGRYLHPISGCPKDKLGDFHFQNVIILFYYIMEKLNKISGDEKKVFHTLLCHEDRNIIKNYSAPEINKILKGLARGLDFDEARVKLFCENIKRSPIVQNDLHVRNIMKDVEGNFKLVDLDRCAFKKENGNG